MGEVKSLEGTSAKVEFPSETMDIDVKYLSVVTFPSVDEAPEGPVNAKGEPMSLKERGEVGGGASRWLYCETCKVSGYPKQVCVCGLFSPPLRCAGY